GQRRGKRRPGRAFTDRDHGGYFCRPLYRSAGHSAAYLRGRPGRSPVWFFYLFCDGPRTWASVSHPRHLQQPALQAAAFRGVDGVGEKSVWGGAGRRRSVLSGAGLAAQIRAIYPAANADPGRDLPRFYGIIGPQWEDFFAREAYGGYCRHDRRTPYHSEPDKTYR